MKTVILRVEGDGPDLHYMYGADGAEPERGVLRGGGEHKHFVIEGNGLLTIGTEDTLATLQPAGDAAKAEGDGTFADHDPPAPAASAA